MLFLYENIILQYSQTVFSRATRDELCLQMSTCAGTPLSAEDTVHDFSRFLSALFTVNDPGNSPKERWGTWVETCLHTLARAVRDGGV